MRNSGVRIVNLGEGDSVAALAVLNHSDLERQIDAEEEGESPEPGGDAVLEVAVSPAVDVEDVELAGVEGE